MLIVFDLLRNKYVENATTCSLTAIQLLVVLYCNKYSNSAAVRSWIFMSCLIITGQHHSVFFSVSVTKEALED